MNLIDNPASRSGSVAAPNPGPAGPNDPRLLRAAEEYLAALEAGYAPPRDEFLNRHADIAPALADCLEGLDLIHAASP